MATVFVKGNPDGIESELAADIFLDWLFVFCYAADFPLDWSYGAYPVCAWPVVNAFAR
jgi:hypothetical protein